MRRLACGRRQFLRRFAASGLVLADSHFRARSAPKASAAGGPYIDVHTHIGRVWNTYSRLTDGDLLRWMDDHNVAKAVVLPLVSPESSSYLTLTEQAIAAANRHPDRLIPFCCIDPRTSYTGGRAGLRLW